MNKKGFDTKYLVKVLIAILMFVIIVGGIILVVSKSIKKQTTCDEQYCVPVAQGCVGNERENTNKFCKDDDLICCMTLEETLGQKKRNPTTTTPPISPNTPTINPTTTAGNIYVKLGEIDALSLVGTTKSLKSGLSYTFKISTDGGFNDCSIKILDPETGNLVQDEAWIVSGTGEHRECKTAKELVLNPGYYQVDKKYILEVGILNDAGILVKSAITNIVIIA